MKLKEITSPANQLLKRVRSLHERAGREKSGMFLLEGPRLLAEALDKQVKLSEIIVSQSYLSAGHDLSELAHACDLYVVADRVFADLVDTQTPAGILAVAAMPVCDLVPALAAPQALIVVAEAIQDPGNFGTILRSALAASACGVIATRGTVDLFNPKVVRAAAGALFRLPIQTDVTINEALDLLKAHQVKVLALDPRALTAYWQVDMTGKTALLVGNEGQGLSAQALERASERVNIPMNVESESLNAALSSSIVMFEAVRQRLAGQASG